MLEQFYQDLKIAHSKRWPERPESMASNLWLFFRSKGLWALLAHRISHHVYLKRNVSNANKWAWLPVSVLFRPIYWLVKIFTKIEILEQCDIAGGVGLSDHGRIILGARKIGAGSEILERVTIGMRLNDEGLPEIGPGARIGPDCVVYGAIIVGAGATLLAGTVLSRTIPSGIVMQGNPARVISKSYNDTDGRHSPSHVQQSFPAANPSR